MSSVDCFCEESAHEVAARPVDSVSVRVICNLHSTFRNTEVTTSQGCRHNVGDSDGFILNSQVERRKKDMRAPSCEARNQSSHLLSSLDIVNALATAFIATS
jgi:hypothetical protein